MLSRMMFIHRTESARGINFGATKHLIKRKASMYAILQVQCAALGSPLVPMKTKPMAFWNKEASATVSLYEDLPPVSNCFPVIY